MAKKIITFKHNGELVYTTVPGTHQEAMTEVCRLFPALQDVDRARLQFKIHTNYTNGKEQHNKVPVRIAPKAWPSMSSGLVRYEVVDVVIGPAEITDQGGSDDDTKSVSSGVTLVTEKRSRSERSWRTMAIFKS